MEKYEGNTSEQIMSQHFQDTESETREHLIHCAFRVSSPAAELAGRFAGLTVSVRYTCQKIYSISESDLLADQTSSPTWPDRRWGRRVNRAEHVNKWARSSIYY